MYIYRNVCLYKFIYGNFYLIRIDISTSSRHKIGTLGTMTKSRVVSDFLSRESEIVSVRTETIETLSVLEYSDSGFLDKRVGLWYFSCCNSLSFPFYLSGSLRVRFFTSFHLLLRFCLIISVK